MDFCSLLWGPWALGRLGSGTPGLQGPGTPGLQGRRTEIPYTGKARLAGYFFKKKKILFDPKNRSSDSRDQNKSLVNIFNWPLLSSQVVSQDPGALPSWAPLASRDPGALASLDPGALASWDLGALASRDPAALASQAPGALASGALASWDPGALASRDPGALASRDPGTSGEARL